MVNVNLKVSIEYVFCVSPGLEKANRKFSSFQISTDAWKAIQTAFFEKYRGVNFSLKFNYNTKKLEESVSLFYLEM